MNKPYKGFIIKRARATGGSAGQGLNKTSSLQIISASDHKIKKSIKYKAGDSASFLKAIQKAYIEIELLLGNMEEAHKLMEKWNIKRPIRRSRKKESR